MLYNYEFVEIYILNSRNIINIKLFQTPTNFLCMVLS